MVLLDVSSSMSGTPLKNAKIGLENCFNQMKDEDRFSIITFDTSAYFKLKPRPVEQLRRQNELPNILNKIFARGCTALYDAIYMAILQIHDKNAPNAIVVLTDGADNSSKHSLLEIKSLLLEFPALRLDIIHVDNSGTPIFAYNDLVADRGTYQVIKVEQIVEITTRVYSYSYQALKV